MYALVRRCISIYLPIFLNNLLNVSIYVSINQSINVFSSLFFFNWFKISKIKRESAVKYLDEEI